MEELKSGFKGAMEYSEKSKAPPRGQKSRTRRSKSARSVDAHARGSTP